MRECKEKKGLAKYFLKTMCTHSQRANEQMLKTMKPKNWWDYKTDSRDSYSNQEHSQRQTVANYVSKSKAVNGL